jgi:DNA-binding transcriptional MerR regulator
MDGTEQIYSIGAVAVRLGLSPTRLRQLEQERVLPPARRVGTGSLRVYSESDIRTLQARLAARKGGTATGIRYVGRME